MNNSYCYFEDIASFPCEITKEVQCVLTFTFIELSEIPNSFAKIRLVLKIKNVVRTYLKETIWHVFYSDCLGMYIFPCEINRNCTSYWEVLFPSAEKFQFWTNLTTDFWKDHFQIFHTDYSMCFTSSPFVSHVSYRTHHEKLVDFKALT